MTTGKYPFEGDTVFLLFENIAKGEFTIPEDVDPLLADLIRGMLQLDPSQRFSVHQIVEHPYVFSVKHFAHFRIRLLLIFIFHFVSAI